MADLNKIKLMAQAILDEVSGATVPDPTPVPDPVPVPTPIPETPPMTTDALVDGLATGATPCGIQVPVAGMKKVGVHTLPAGISATSTELIFNGFSGDWDDPEGWDIGSRRMVFKTQCGYLRNLRSSGGIAGSLPLIHTQPGGGFEALEFSDIINASASMLLKQESGSVAGIIRRNKMLGMSQDATKISGGNIIEENLIGPATFRGGAPHADAFTAMAAVGGIIIRYNNVNWSYAQTDESGINNWLRVEAYKVGAVFDDIEVYGNKLVHTNPGSFAIHFTTKNSPVWNGSAKFNTNRMKKAGGNQKILYASSPRISEWGNNIDLNTGLVIPLSAT